MSVRTINVLFIDEKNNAFEMPVPGITPSDLINIPSKTFFAQKKGEQDVKIMQGNLSPDWIGYNLNQYKKTDEIINGALIYKFEKSIYVERCPATTKSGSRCKNACIQDGTECKTHSK
jgi:hypothetical protein